MTDAGFFRGTSADQDNRFADKQKKLLKEMNFSPILNTKLNMSKIDIESIKPWIEQKIRDVLEKDDELLSGAIFEHLAEKEPDGKNILVLITGFVEDTKASKFMEDLWTKLIDIQETSNGVASPKEPTSPGNGISSEAPVKSIESENQAVSTDAEKAEEPQRKSRSRSHSRSGSRKSSVSARSGSKQGSHSRSHSPKSSSRSRSSSKSLRRSRSRSRSPHRHSHRLRRSRSRSGSYRGRSRSPRGRRGYISRASYRGGFGYHDRRRGFIGGPIRRRPSPPWGGHRRFSPRSPPPRRRRTPSISPRRRSRSPYYRRSRSPLYGHAMNRRSPPRQHGGPHIDMLNRRHMPHHDMHRPIVPRGPIDHRAYGGDGMTVPRHSPGPLMPVAPLAPGPSRVYSPSPSPSSSRKKHKKDKKHRKHSKKSKKHRSSSPERRKKHKKHKKAKKHKS